MFYDMDFSLIEKWKQELLTKHPYGAFSTKDMGVFVFPQMWGSTNTAFDGISGSAMTQTHTTVFVVSANSCHFARVYVGQRHAYDLNNGGRDLSDTFHADIGCFHIASQSDAKRIYGHVILPGEGDTNG